jgi:4'-phosphopantetheinyl transferase EntD
VIPVVTPWPDRVLVVRDVDTYDGWFGPDELAVAGTFKLDKRRHDWLLSRLAAKSLALQLGLARDPRAFRIERPRILVDGAPQDVFVSLSHSAPYAGAAIARDSIGIDVETIRELSPNAAHLFLTDDEIREAERCRTPNTLLHFWSAKEAAWKKLGGSVATLKQVPLHVDRETHDGIRFVEVETFRSEDVIVAVTTER